MEQSLLDVVFLRLDEALTCEPVDEVIKKLQFEHTWYLQSYRPFIRRFTETRGEQSLEVWAERVALIYSWLPKIPLSSFSIETEKLDENVARLVELENIFYDAEISTVGRTSYHGILHHGETIFPSYKGYFDVALREFLEPASVLLHKNVNLDTQLSSTTKLLHFMCPYLFPIFDTKVCKQIFGTPRQSYEKYHAYLFGLQQYLEKGKISFYIQQRARELQLSPLYIIDFVVFNLEKMKLFI